MWIIGSVLIDLAVPQVDRLIGRGHLFKRSIILVKAWCYYESRILGAHRGLFSSYALETLVLYIFNVFHKRLQRPLDVRPPALLALFPRSVSTPVGPLV